MITGIDGDPAPTNLPHGGIDGDTVGAGVIPALTPQNISKYVAGRMIITAKGVRAGMSPAPTNPPGATLDHAVLMVMPSRQTHRTAVLMVTP